MPRRVGAIATTALKLDALEAFVLSQIDGMLNVEELAAVVALDEIRVIDLIDRLAERGAVEWDRARPLDARSRHSRPVGARDLRREEPSDRAAPHPAPAKPTRTLPEVDRRDAGAPREIRRDPRADEDDGPPSHVVEQFPPARPRPSSARVDRTSAPRVERPSSPPPSSRSGRSSPPPRPSRPASSAVKPASAGATEGSPKPSGTVATKPFAPPKPSVKIPTTATLIVEEVPASELSEDERRRFTELADRLFDVTHYELLEVPSTADRARILEAFALLAPRYDPTKRQGLGAARAALLAIFQRLVHARDVLSSAAGRTEYDRYLELRARARAYENTVKSMPPPDPSRPSGPPTVDPSSTSKVRAVAGGPSDATRRNALALQMLSESAKHRAVRPSQGPISTTNPSVKDLAAAESAIRTTGPIPEVASVTETMRRRSDELRQAAIKAQVDKLSEQATAALAEGDPGLAVVHFKAALDLKDSPELRAQLDAAARAVGETPVSANLEQARFEEEAGRWLEAGRAYEKAYARRPEPRFAERAANAFVQAGAEVKRALQLAEEASAKLPDSVQILLTLASAYLRDGQLRRARTVLERAAKLEPSDRRAEELLRKI